MELARKKKYPTSGLPGGYLRRIICSIVTWEYNVLQNIGYDDILLIPTEEIYLVNSKGHDDTRLFDCTFLPEHEF